MMKKGKSKSGGSMLPSSLKIISSCVKTVATNASSVVRSAGASIVASVSASSHATKDQVTWSSFDRLVISLHNSKRVLLLGYQNGFQVYDVQEAANITELVSKKDCGIVSFLQILPIPAMSTVCNGRFGSSHPLLLVVAREEVVNHTSNEGGLNSTHLQGNQSEINGDSPRAVKFYSLKTNCFVHIREFLSAVCMIRCSTKMVAVALPTQIYCIDAVTLEDKFSVLTYPIPQFVRHGKHGVNVGYGPMAVGPRWLAYASESPIMTSKSRLSPKNLNSSQVVSTSLSQGNSSNQLAHYAMESGKHIAAGLLNMGDKGYRTLSRYCREWIQDGLNSPSSSSSGWKCGRHVASPRTENAGMVVVKDFASGAIISQFSAHTSPISALCFDPSGTLLVTVSVHGNNINIFRITPTYAKRVSGDQTYDLSSAHAHLYKLYRGMTSAIIQDICFNHCSRWIALISSKGTCHIYTLSPFGGEIEFQTSDCHSEWGPVLSSPWWSSSTFLIDPLLSLPPETVTLSVVCRIKDYVSGVINSVSNVASLAGNGYIPSGATTGIFHNSMAVDVRDSSSGSNMLEHLLVYSPSGHLVQYRLLPGVGVQSSKSRLLSQSNSRIHAQDSNLEVNLEPIEWWDVCRKSDGIERDASLEFPIVSKQEAFEVQRNNYLKNYAQFNSNIVGEKTSRGVVLNAHEKSYLYVCNAELQIKSGRLPIWHNRKIYFQRMALPRNNIHNDGENEIEKFHLHEVETKGKDLLPVFDNSQCITSERKKSPITSSPDVARQMGENVMKETGICHSHPAALSSVKDSNTELKYGEEIPRRSSRTVENIIDFGQNNNEKDHVNNLYMQISNTVKGLETSPLQKNLPSTISSLHPGNDLDADECITEVVLPLEEKKNLSFESPDKCDPLSDNLSSEDNEEDNESNLIGGLFAV